MQKSLYCPFQSSSCILPTQHDTNSAKDYEAENKALNRDNNSPPYFLNNRVINTIIAKEYTKPKNN